MEQNSFNKDLLAFIQQSPTPFHAVKNIKSALEQAGFHELKEMDHWPKDLLGDFYIVRNDSSLIALCLKPEQSLIQDGIRLVGAHTDSPCIIIKPGSQLKKHNALQLNIEVYGGALLHTWFDRDLSIAGRVHYTEVKHHIKAQNQIKERLIDLKSPIATIPSLAIHLNREANNNSSVNPQKDIAPILLQHPTLLKHPTKAENLSLEDLILSELNSSTSTTTLLDHALYLYDTQPPKMTGLNQSLISSARIDNLAGCFVGLHSLLSASNSLPAKTATQVLVCHDHEEVGSQSYHGANSHFVKDVLQRLAKTPANYNQMMAHSMMISVDSAHAVHPNFADKHDGLHMPILNGGPVIKYHASQRYATNSLTSSLIKALAATNKIPLQYFTMRNDMGCGSTIGPMSAAHLGIRTLDIGIPQWAMHSIRETAGAEDAFQLNALLKAFYNTPSLPA